MTFVAVSALVLLGLAPWWWAGGSASQRLAALGDEASPACPDQAPSDGAAVPEHTAPDGVGRVDVPVLLELVAAAVRSGAGVTRALEAVGDAVCGPDGRALRAVAAGLRLGADWDDAWARAPGAGGLDPVRRALRGAWVDGAAPGEALRAAGQEVLGERRSAARTAAARLAVRLVVPLGVCFLPAFVLLGLAPVLLALGVDLLSG